MSEGFSRRFFVFFINLCCYRVAVCFNGQMEREELEQAGAYALRFQGNGSTAMHNERIGKLESELFSKSQQHQSFDTVARGECTSQMLPFDVASLKCETRDTTSSGGLSRTQSGQLLLPFIINSLTTLLLSCIYCIQNFYCYCNYKKF